MKKSLVLVTLFLFFQTTCFATFYSQCGQDKYIYENFFHECRDAVFVDIGAHDGMSFSNTCFFEKEMGWKGICVEPIPKIFAELQKNRKCTLINGCVADWSGQGQFLMISGTAEMLSGLLKKYDPKHVARIQQALVDYGGRADVIGVHCYLLNEILDKHGITHVNFLSLDTEGGELDIISKIDFDRFQIDVIALENNYGDPNFLRFLQEKGFYLAQSLDQDMIFVNKKFTPHSK